MIRDTVAVPTTDKDLDIPFIKETILISITDRVLRNVLIKPKEEMLVTATDNNLLVDLVIETIEIPITAKFLK